jgi:spermidine synthase
MQKGNLRSVLLYAGIFVSGASGLIYEVVWHRYLAILLGAQARATAITLAIFLGGISLGYLYFGRWSRHRGADLFRTYVIIELGLAIWGALFIFLFHLAQPAASAMYRLFGVNSIFIDIVLSVVLIGIPTFLMGGTLPLLTQAMSQGVDKASQTHARIYGINTLGACLGSLLSGYLLIPWLGLRISEGVAASGNVLVGTVVYFVYVRHLKTGPISTRPAEPIRLKIDRKDVPILTIGFLSGFYLITLQTILVRLVGLSTGSSNYNFSLIVTIFIFGLGIGSLLARRIDHYTSSRLLWNQLWLSALLFVLYLSANSWAYWGHVLRVLFRDLPQGFYPFQASLGLGFTLLLVVPIGFAGLTLPLCFHFLKDRSDNLGHRVGQLYGINTLGCVFGALIGGYYLLNFFNLDQLFKFCVFLSALTAVAAFVPYLQAAERSAFAVGSAVALLLFSVLGSVFGPAISKNGFVQPFRHTQVIPNVTFNGRQAFDDYLASSNEYLFYKDGPNTSVGVGKGRYQGQEFARSIINNGKSDGHTRGDFFTMALLGHIPALLAGDPQRACVIGFGTGTTIGTLGLYPEVKSIDVAEISGTLIEKRSLFDMYNYNVSTNPKVQIHEMDAFRFLEGTGKKFDIIVSEPSNPWVTGIENLYSHEFYQLAHNKLDNRGLFVQWIHTYSFNDELLRMVFRTMTDVFPYVAGFELKGGDLALVASRTPLDRGDLKRAARRFGQTPELKKVLNEAGVERFETVLALELVPFSLSKVVGEGADEQRLEVPKLSNAAAKAFFANTQANLETLRRQYREYYPAVMDSLLADYTEGRLAGQEVLQSFRKTFCDNYMSRTSFMCEQTMAALKVRNPLFRPELTAENSPSTRDLASLESYTTLPKGKFTQKDLDAATEVFNVYKKYHSPLSILPDQAFLGRADYCIETVSPREELYGQCLLQKILMLETVRMRAREFKEAVASYTTWFDKLSESSPSYGKLKEARDILVKLISMERLEEEKETSQ